MASARRFGMSACVLALSGCQFIPGTDASFERAARRAVLLELSDPGSAQFRDERVAVLAAPGASITFACGLVNAKNPLGGYEGFRPYAYVAAFKGIVGQQNDVMILPVKPSPMESSAFPPACMPGQMTTAEAVEMDRDNADAMAPIHKMP